MSNKTKRVRWGIIGPGMVAHRFAEDIQSVFNAQLLAVALRSQDKARAFAQIYKAESAYDDYRFLAEDTSIDAV